MDQTIKEQVKTKQSLIILPDLQMMGWLKLDVSNPTAWHSCLFTALKGHVKPAFTLPNGDILYVKDFYPGAETAHWFWLPAAAVWYCGIAVIAGLTFDYDIKSTFSELGKGLCFAKDRPLDLKVPPAPVEKVEYKPRACDPSE